MKGHLLLKLFFLVCVLGCTSCSHEILSGAMQSAPVKIDGRINDWEIPLRFYDEKTQINYCVTNDKNYLFVCMRIPDVQMQSKIMRAGMEVWIDTTAKRKTDVGVLFPLPTGEKVKYDSHTGIEPPTFGNGSQHDKLKKRENFIAANKEMQLKGFKPPFAGIVPIHNDSGISVSMNWDSTNTLIYEAKIPFRTFYKQTLSSADSVKIFDMGIVLNGMQVVTPSSRNQSAAMNPASTGNNNMLGSNSRLSGMDGGSGGGGHGKDYNVYANPKKVWVRIRLAVK